MVSFCRKIADAKWFSQFILAIIIFAGVVVGMQTYKGFEAEHHTILSALDSIILWIFVVEAVIKIVAEGTKPQNYFKDPWNLFDFSIVVVCFLPIGGDFLPVLRLARVLRVLKLVSAVPRLQILVNAVLRSVPSIGYVFVLGLVHFYIYGCMATFLFSENDPIHFRNLQTSMLSLFQAVTLEGWSDLMYINMYGSADFGYDESTYTALANIGIPKEEIISTPAPLTAAVFFVTFVLSGAMIVLNLFVGVMLTGMEEARKEINRGKEPEFPDETDTGQGTERSSSELKDDLAHIENQLATLSDQLAQTLAALDKKTNENSDKLDRILQDS